MENLRHNSSYNMLCEAIKKRKTWKTHLLLLNNASVNIPNARNNTPLHWAITQFQDLEIIKMLLDRGADVHAKNHKYKKPLETAIENNRTEAAILLIRKGALVGEDLNALLLTATKHYDYTVFKELIDYGMQHNSSINFNTLFNATISQGTSKMVEYIISHCQFWEPSDKIIPKDLVIKRSCQEYKKCVEMLLQRNFTISPNSNRDGDFVYGAVKNGHLLIVLQLLKLGIDVNIVNPTTRLSLLKVACLNKHYEVVENLLKHNACVNVTTPTDNKVLKYNCSNIRQRNYSLSSIYDKKDLQNITCLHIAVLNCDPKTTKLLLKYGAKIVDDPQFFHVTCIAVRVNYEEIVQIFLEHSVNVNDIDSRGKSLLHFCVITGGKEDSRYNIAKMLLKSGAAVHLQTPGNALLFDALKNGHRKIAQLFLDYDPNVQYISPDSNTSLHQAIRKNFDVEFIKKILKLNSPVNVVNKRMLTPLLTAVRVKSKNQYEIIELLLRYNANVNCVIDCPKNSITDKSSMQPSGRWDSDLDLTDYSLFFEGEKCVRRFNKQGKTPLHFVCKHKNDMTARTIQLLLEYNANIEAEDAKGRTPLFEACCSHNDVAVKCLLDNNANANHTDAENLTPIYFAIKSCYPKIVNMLLELGVDLHCIDKEGKSMIHVIVENGEAEFIKSLVNTHVDFNSLNKNGSTALHYAAQQISINKTKNLIKYGANVNILDKKKHTPLREAIKWMTSHQKQYEKWRSRRYTNRRHSDDEGWDTDIFEDDIKGYKKIIKMLKIQVVKLKTAGLKVNKQNMKLVYEFDDYYSDNESSDDEDTDYRFDVLQFEVKCEEEIEKMRMEKVGVCNMTLYDLLKKNIHSLSRFVKNKKIKQTLELQVYDEKFPLYMDIIRSRFRDAKLRYRFVNSAKKYFSLNICPRLSDDCIDNVFSYLNIKDINIFILAMKQSYD